MTTKANTYGIKKARSLRWAKESAAGAGGLATTIYPGAAFSLKDNTQVVTRDQNAGYLSGLTGNKYIPATGSEISCGPDPLTFQELQRLCDAGINNSTPAADGGGSAHVGTYNLPYLPTHGNVLKTRAAEIGDNQEVEFVPYCFVSQIKITGAPDQALQVTSTWPGRACARNLYTANMTFVANTKKIVDAANGLAIFTTGMTIRVSGSVSNDGIYTIATGGVAGEIVVNETLVLESTPVGTTIDQVFTSTATLPADDVIKFNMGKLYLNPVGTAFPGTQVVAWKGFEMTIDTGWQAESAGSGRLDLAYIKCIGANVTVMTTFEYYGPATDEKANWKNLVPRKLRMLFQGKALTTAGTYAVNTAIFDLAGMWDSFDVIDEQNGDDIVKGTFSAAYDGTAALFAQIVTVMDAAAAL